LIRATFAIPGDLSSPTGGYAYDRAVIAAGPAVGLTLDVLALPGGFPLADDATVRQAADLLAAAPADRPLLVDGLALGAMPAELLAGVRAPLAALLHHPLALETGLSEAQAAHLRATEGAALALCRAIVVTSAATAATAAEMFGLPVDRFTVARPGLARRAPAPLAGRPPVVLTVGSLIPRKGHDVLIDALAQIKALPWRAEIYGSGAFAPDWAQSIRERIEAAGLSDRIRLHGAVDEEALAAAYHAADVFCLPSRYEGYGMVFAEAMAHGLPVVAADIAAAREVVPPAVGAFAEVGRPGPLAQLLAILMVDDDARRARGAAAHAHADTLPGWDDAARAIAAALVPVGVS
jgi:glycosyltransferase involved in cell wall biosynthesis